MEYILNCVNLKSMFVWEFYIYEKYFIIDTYDRNIWVRVSGFVLFSQIQKDVWDPDHSRTADLSGLQ